MEKLRTYVFSAIVILIISFGDEAESKLMEIDRRLKRAVEAWRNGTSLTRADSYLKSKCQRTKFEAESGGVIGTFIPSCESDGTYSPTQFWGSTGYSWCALADGTEVPGTRTRPGVARNTDCSIYREPRGIYANIPHLRQSTPSTVVKYGCFWSRCWRSCKKGEQDPSGYFKKKNPPEPIETWHEFCQNDEWCYSDLGTCSTDARCKEAPKWGCYGTGWGRPDGLYNGRVVIGGDDAPCPGFKGYYCDTKTGRSFGCSDSLSRMWRSCDAGEDSSCTDGYCFVDSGYCTYDIKSIVATVLDCV